MTMTDNFQNNRQYQCPWCNQYSNASGKTCPSCGSSIDVRMVVTQGGWSKLPPIKDMTKIQFGQSFCQIEGTYVPVVDFKLASGDRIYFGHHLLLWKDDLVKMNGIKLTFSDFLKKLFAGLPLLMTEARGPGSIAFSKDKPGELVALPLQPGESIDVRERAFMIATSSIIYDWLMSKIWFKSMAGKDIETIYPIGIFIDRFTAINDPGLLLLHGAGNVFFKELSVNETILIKPKSLLFKDPNVNMHLHIEYPRSPYQISNQRAIWLQLSGPGRVAIESHYEFMEGEQSYISGGGSRSTEKRW